MLKYINHDYKMVFKRQDGKNFDLREFDLYDIDYKLSGDRIKVKNKNNGRYYDISNRFGQSIVNRATDNSPELLLRNNKARNRFRALALDALNESRERKKREVFRYYKMKDGCRGRIYFINNLDVSMYSDEVKSLISARLKHALRTGITKKANVSVRFILKNNADPFSKTFSAFLIKDVSDFWRAINEHNDLTTANTPDYTNTIIGIVIKIFEENSGGCSDRKHKTRIGNAYITEGKTGNNNCFFCETLDLLDINAKRMGRVKGNNIRRDVGLEPDSLIPISKAIEIFEKYKNKDVGDIAITDQATKIRTRSRTMPNKPVVRELILENEHYKTVSAIVNNKCKDCGKEYVNKHNCNPQKCQYYQQKILKSGKRFLLCSDTREDYNNQDEIIHFDQETFRDDTIAEGFKIHNPYITGFNDGDEFKFYAGKDNVKKFVDHIIAKGESITNKNLERNKAELTRLHAKLKTKLTKDQKKKASAKIGKLSRPPTLYVNAYNGSNFDHYSIFQEFINRGLKPDNHIINNGSVISFKYKNIKLFDMCKHLQGSLADNLKAMKCDIKKGEFNHDDAKLDNGWEGMPPELKESCLKYLKSDVMGMRELYNKLNTAIYDEHKVNLSSFISTSSLTFNMWKKNIRGKFSIQLPNLKQEEAFRQAVRGGRTYKSKHQFISEDYEAYHEGKCGFDDIKDYVIDADVVSLYPTAMAHYPYPVGDCKELSESTDNTPLEMKGEMGIYQIEYEANKHLIHSIGGRREEKTNSLKWDLKDGAGWYTSIDIEDMLANGYKVKIIKGYYWEKVEYIFKDYIEKLFKKKEAEAKAGRKGSAAYMLAKLWMNGLYGKNIQRPIYSKSTIVKNNVEYWKFWGDNIITDTRLLKNNKGEDIWYVTGTPRTITREEKCITKPTQLGAFILAYSRRIMLNYMKEANPHFDISSNPSVENQKKQIENDIYYTDTDSLQMHSRNANLIKDLGNKSLGGITDDLGDNCKIIKGLWIAPKLYMLEYIKKDHASESFYHFRGKGLNKEDLTVQQFNDMANGKALSNTRKFQMKKVHIKKNSKQTTIPTFSILHYSKDTDPSRLTRVVNSKPWDGRRFIGNDSLPHT